MQERDKKREQKKMMAQATLRQIKEEECLEEMACQCKECRHEEKEHKQALCKCMEQEGTELQCQ